MYESKLLMVGGQASRNASGSNSFTSYGILHTDLQAILN